MNDVELKKMYWHSRRGMLELDLILLPFVRDCLPALPVEDQACYRELLSHEDQDLYNWLIGRQPAPTPALMLMVDSIRAYQQRGATG